MPGPQDATALYQTLHARLAGLLARPWARRAAPVLSSYLQ